MVRWCSWCAGVHGALGAVQHFFGKTGIGSFHKKCPATPGLPYGHQLANAREIALPGPPGEARGSGAAEAAARLRRRRSVGVRGSAGPFQHVFGRIGLRSLQRRAGHTLGQAQG
eukprot:gene18052-biopygen9920